MGAGKALQYGYLVVARRPAYSPSSIVYGIAYRTLEKLYAVDDPHFGYFGHAPVGAHFVG